MKNSSRKQISFRETLLLHARGIKELGKILPQLLPSLGCQAAAAALTPYVLIFFSARILNELSVARRPEEIWRWVIWTVAAGGMLSVLNALLTAWKNVQTALWWTVYETPFSRKMFSMDYADMDNPYTHERYAQIDQNLHWGGRGLSRLIDIVPGTVQALVGMISAAALTVGLFASPVPKEAGWLCCLNHPLFIPEIRKDSVSSSYALYAFGAKNALCFSPFGIEDLALDPSELDKPPMELMIALNIDPSAFDITGSRDCLSATYGLLEQLEPLYLQYRGTPSLQVCVRHGEVDYSSFLRFGSYDLIVKYGPRMSGKPLGCCYVIELSEDRFLLAGLNCTPEFRVKPGTDRKVEILRLEEGRIVDGKWVPGRVLNGDERMNLRFGDMPGTLMVELHRI